MIPRRYATLAAALAAALPLGALGAGPAAADGAALVRVVTPQRGEVTATVTAYGEATPASASVRSLTLAQTGQVTAVLVTAGQAVRRGQALLRLENAPAAVASFRQAQTAVTLAVQQQAHTAQLLSQQLATRDQMSAADKAVTDARAQLSALSQDGAGRAAITVSAPFAGVVTAVPVSIGDRPAAGSALVILAPATGLVVTVGIEPGWRGQVRPGQVARLAPLGGGPAILGRVIRVDALLNPKTRLVDVDIATPPGAVLSGQAFQADIETGALRGWLVPHAAVRIEAGKAFVIQAAGDKAARVEVRVLRPGRDTDVVDGPIDPQRPIVTDGSYQLDDGDPLRIAR